MPANDKTFYEKEVERIYSVSPLNEYQYALVRRARSFMEENYSTDIQLENMAAASFMSRFHFNRIFKDAYGIPPRHYLRDLRMHKAKGFLKKGIPVTQVCFEVGYKSVSTFSRTFKKATGYSPKAFQVMHLSNRG